jgi:hypothetical protein
VDDGRIRETTQQESDSRWRSDRDERLRRASRDAKRIERAERHTARHDAEPTWHVGSAVRTVAA